MHRFSNQECLAGITELEHDVFYVIALNYSQSTNKMTPGAAAVYRVDMCGDKPKISLAAKFPNAILLDGITPLSPKSNILLVADAGAGVLYTLDVKTGATAIVMEDPTMKPFADHPVGIDGIKVRDNNLYFTNHAVGTFVKIPMNPDGTAAGPAVMLLTGWQIDDFTFGPDGESHPALFFSIQDPGPQWRTGFHTA